MFDSTELETAEKSLIDITQELRKKGYGLNFTAQPNSKLSSDTGMEFKPEQLRIREVYRLEGESNPDDMCVVFGLESVDDESIRGVFIEAYGPKMTASQAAISTRLLRAGHVV
jgi:hypothetical protein